MQTQGLNKGALLRHETYRIEKILGQGGFGITYLATDLSLDRLVAIKEFFPKDYCERDHDTSHLSIGTSGSSDFVSRLKAKFLKEARNIAKFDHPGIIKIHAAFEENNTAYYVMDYIEGESLSDKIKREGPLSEEVALNYITKAGEALAYIHQQKMNHLDVKPANIMIRQADNFPILIDFGLSKQYDSEGNQTSTTPVGISHGFAPLEQYNDGGVKEFSPQTDIYSLAATLYYLVSGVTPPHATQLIEEEISFPTGFPANLISAISIAMSSARKHRYSAVSYFLTALKPTDETTDIAAPTVISVPSTPIKPIEQTPTASKTEERAEPNPIKWLILIGIIAVVVMVSLYFWRPETSEVINSPISAKEITQNTAAEPTPISAKEITQNTAAGRVPTPARKLMNYLSAFGECVYAGEFDQNGDPHGHGIAIWDKEYMDAQTATKRKRDAQKYDGQWVHGVMEGEATYTLQCGDTFVGTFKNNEYQKGRYTIKLSGEYFEGTFKNGQPDQGYWYDKNGKRL